MNLREKELKLRLLNAIKLGVSKFIDDLVAEYGGTMKSPKSYWVRSSQNFNFAEYNAKAISTFAKGDRPEGAWVQSGSCTYLHNAGYIIVDKFGEAVTKNTDENEIPDSKPYLIKGDDRITAVAITYYIRPNQIINESGVIINDLELANLIGPTVGRSDVLKVLDGIDFTNHADVKLIEKTEFSEGSTDFLFEFKRKFTMERDEDIIYRVDANKSLRVVTYYERKRENRKKAIEKHGHCCKACGVDMGKRYGKVAAGFIEVHHLTPGFSNESNGTK